MTALRRRMDDDILARGLADRTRESYLWAVTGLARFYRRSPDQITDEEIKRMWCICCATDDSRGEFFRTLARQQSPQYLWIGCADSRVPANQIVGLLPGELFVHRNVANVVVHTNLNCLSVMQFAVEVLKVRHILVVGHYGCSGVEAALLNRRIGLADNWLRHIQDVRLKHSPYLEALPEEQRAHRLCDLNVIEHVVNVCQTTVVQEAWERGQELAVPGWTYAIEDGLVRDLTMDVTAPADLAPAYFSAVGALG